MQDPKSFAAKALEDLRLKLLDLTKRNRLLNFKNNKSSVRIVDEQPKQVFQRLVSAGDSMIFAPLPEPKVEPNSDMFYGLTKKQTKEQLIATAGELAGINVNDDLPLPYLLNDETQSKHMDNRLQTKLFMPELETRLRRIRSDANSVIQETGQNQLYIAMGFLEWKERGDSNETYEAPLILVPIAVERGRIETKSRCYNYSISYTGEDLIPNLSLAEKLKREFDLILPLFDDSDVLVSDSEGEELDPEAYFDAVGKVITDMKGWLVRRKMILGFFTFSKLLMYLDLDPRRWPNKSILEHNLIQDLLEGHVLSSGTGNSDENSQTELHDSLPVVIDADSSQTAAINYALTGQSIVIQGPPGTGKSQTITNLIACFLSQGKSILFVAEKMAALNVVQRNLERVGLSDFCLELHSHKSNKKHVLEDLKQRLQQKHLSPKNYEAQLERLEHVKHHLAEYANLMETRVGFFGETIFEVFWKAEQYGLLSGNSVDFSIDSVEGMSQKDITDRTDCLAEIARFISTLGLPSAHVLYGYRPVELYFGDHEKVLQKIAGASEAIDMLDEQLQRLFATIRFDLAPLTLTTKNLRALVELGSKAVPDDLLPDIVCSFLRDPEAAWESFSVLESLIEAYKVKSEQASRVLDTSKVSSIDALKSCVQILDLADRKQLSQLSLSATNDVAVTCGNVITFCDKVSTSTKEQVVDGMFTPTTIEQYEKFLSLDALIRSRPTTISGKLATNLFSSAFKETVDQMLQEGERLRSIRDDLSQKYDISLIPSAEDIVEFRKTWRQSQLSPVSLLNSRFRNAKKVLTGFVRDGSKLKDYDIAAKKGIPAFKVWLYEITTGPLGKKDMVSELEELEAYIKACDKFMNNKAYSDVLEAHFDGLDTDWDAVKQIFYWREQVYKLANSLTLARRLALLPSEAIENWPNRCELEQLLESLKRELAFLSDLFKGTMYENQTHRVFETPIDRLSANLRNFRKLLHQAYMSVSSYVLDHRLNLYDILHAFKAYIASLEIESDIVNNNNIASFLGERFDGANTNISEINSTINWLSELRQLNLPNDMMRLFARSDMHEVISQIDASVETWHDSLMSLCDQLDTLAAYGSLDEQAFWTNERDSIALSKIKDKLEQCRARAQDLVQWADYCRVMKRAEELGLGSFIIHMENGGLDSEKAVNTFLKVVYISLAKKVVRDNPLLSSFTKEQHEAKRSTFKELDLALQELLRKKIAHVAGSRKIPFGIGKGPIREWTEMALLDHEFNKSRRHIPIRKLIQRSGNAIRAMKPVFMMSPMSVAQFLEPGMHHFDAIVMDEASQIKPHEALGTIARGTQMIIVGDPKQLPPTTFFDTAMNNPDDEEREETLADDTDSILDISLSAHFPCRRLQWHYRSEHEDLIAFSNAQWYDNSLIIFPSPISSDTQRALHFHYIENARYSNRKNELEAETVARRIIDHARNMPHLSLGVGTLNLSQKELIEDRLDQLCKKDPSSEVAIKALMRAHGGNEPLFIKNLENLQGDERDVIFISCTYGPDKETGKVYQRFGPINGPNGPKRLNVLFTRAKKRMEIFSSMQSEDVRIGPDSSEGSVALRRFLDYARTGRLTERGEHTNREPDSDFEKAVANELSNHGYRVVPQVGVSGYFVDIGVCHPHRPGEYILGIECDGASYHSTRFARDRDRLREEVLLMRGWKLYRIWSTDWFKNRQATVDNLLSMLQSLVGSERYEVREVETPGEKVMTTSLPLSESMPDTELRSRLLAYKRLNIPNRAKEDEDGILRKEMLDLFVSRRPTTRDEYKESFSGNLRGDTDPDDIQYLDDILGIVEQAEGHK